MLTPLTLLQRDVPPAHVETPRSRDDCEFLWLLSGSLRYTALGSPVDITPDMLLFRRPGLPDLLEFSPTQTSRTLAVTFALDPRSLPPGFSPPEAWPSLRLLPRGDILRPLFRHLLTHRDALDYQTDPPLIEGTLSLMFHIFVAGRTRTFDAPRPVVPEPIAKTIAFIRRIIAFEPSRRLSADDLQVASGWRARGHFDHYFRQHTGYTAPQYLRLARIDLAIRLLRETDWPIGVCAATAGFHDYDHLVRYIRRHLDCRPADLRRLSIAGQLPPLAPLADLDPLSDDPDDDGDARTASDPDPAPADAEADPEPPHLPTRVMPRKERNPDTPRVRFRRATSMDAEAPHPVIVRRSPLAPGR